MSIQSSFAKNPSLRSASRAALEALAKVSTTRTYDPGARVITRGAAQDQVALLAEGRMELYVKNHETDAQILQAVISSPAIFGDAELFAGLGRWAVSARAVGALTVVWIPVASYERLIAEEPQVAAGLYRNACWRLMMAVQLNIFMSLQPTHEKILQLFRTAARGLPDLSAVALSTSEIGRAIGVDRKTVARNIAALEKAGALVRRGNGWVIAAHAQATELDSMGDRSSWKLPGDAALP